jgi:hypothetical protein
VFGTGTGSLPAGWIHARESARALAATFVIAEVREPSANQGFGKHPVRATKGCLQPR